MPKKPALTDEEIEAALAEIYDNHRTEIYEMIYEYADDEDLEEGFVARLLLDLAVSARLNAYVAETEDPSLEGLVADLDRFGKDVLQLVAEAKKDAPAFIEAVLNEQANGEDDDED